MYFYSTIIKNKDLMFLSSSKHFGSFSHPHIKLFQTTNSY